MCVAIHWIVLCGTLQCTLQYNGLFFVVYIAMCVAIHWIVLCGTLQCALQYIRLCFVVHYNVRCYTLDRLCGVHCNVRCYTLDCALWNITMCVDIHWIVLCGIHYNVRWYTLDCALWYALQCALIYIGLCFVVYIAMCVDIHWIVLCGIHCNVRWYTLDCALWYIAMCVAIHWIVFVVHCTLKCELWWLWYIAMCVAKHLVGLVRPKYVPLPDTSTNFGREWDIELFMTYLIVNPKISDRHTQLCQIKYFQLKITCLQITGDVLQVILMFNYSVKILCRWTNII